MKRTLLLLIVCLYLFVVGNAQTRKPVKKTTTPVSQAPAPPSANGKFKFIYSKERDGFFNNTDNKDFVIITVPGKSASDIKSSIISTLSGMYANPSKVISTLGDNIINVNPHVSDAFQKSYGNFLWFYSFSYNIKIEIKEGKIKVDSPTFSMITKKELYMEQMTGTEYITEKDMYSDLYFAKEIQQAKIEALINCHITQIVSGLSSSDW